MKKPTTPGLWWVKYRKERKRKLVCVVQGKNCLMVEMPRNRRWPIDMGCFSYWQKAGRPAAKTGSKATAIIQLRVSPKRKRAYQKKATGSLSAWVLRVCDRAAGFKS